MNDLSKNVKNVMVVFLLCFIGLISYMAYFQIFEGPEIAIDPGNVRVMAEKNKVLRGTIYDKDMNPLTSTERIDDISQKREYLYGGIFVHPLGYSDLNYGVSGLEATYNQELSSYSVIGNNVRAFIDSVQPKVLIKEMIADKKETGSFNFKENFGEFVNKIGFSNNNSEKIGNSIVTTLDTNLQQLAHSELGSRKGAVVALNPKTGEILAMVSTPTFNPNNLKEEMEIANSGTADETPLINRAINGLYPPGSVFKTVTLASALENIDGVRDRVFEDKGKIIFDDGTELNNFASNVYGNISLKDAYRVSSNVAFGTLALDIGNNTLKSTAEKFGFNSAIKGQGFTAESSRFPTLESYESGNIAQSGIGQSSILVTPMQMALVASTVANDGVMMTPKLTSKIIDKDGNTVKNINNEEKGKIISSKDAETIQEYMKNLVDNNLGRWPAFQGTNAGGKTGTADYNLPDGTPATPHGWFIAAAPIEDPEIAVAVIVENGESGSGIAATIASRIVREAVLGE